MFIRQTRYYFRNKQIMAGTVGSPKKVVIDFSIMSQDAVRNIQALNKELDALKVRQLQLKAAKQQDSEEYIKNQAAIKAYTQALKANEKELDNNIKAQQEDATSLNAMRATLRSLTAQYADLSKAERESAEGSELLAKIDQQRQEVEKLEHSLGDYGRQVGNYSKAVEGMTGPVGKAVGVFKQLSGGTMNLATAFKNGIGAVKDFSVQLLKLMMNPIVAAIAAIAAAVMKLVQAFKRSDNAMTALQSAFAGFQPIINAVNKAFEWLVGGITKALNGIGKLIALIGGDASKVEQEHIKRIDELEEADRQYTVNHAKNEAEIADLRDKAMDREQYTAEERKKFLQQAMDIEEADAKEKRRLAKERYEIAKKEAENNRDTSDQTKDRLAELQAAMYQADKEYSEMHRSLLREQNKFQKEIDKEAAEAQKEREQKAKEWAAAQKERQQKEQEEIRKAEDLAVEMLAEGYEKERQILENTYKRQIEDTKKRLNEEKNLTVKARQALNEQLVLLQAQMTLKLGDLDEKYRDENLRKEFEYQVKLNEVRIAGMQEGYNKQMEQFQLQRKQLTYAYEKEIANAKTDEERNKITELFQMQMNLIGQNEDKLKESVQNQIRELSGLNDLQQQLYDIEVDGFRNKESRKAEIMQQKAEERLRIAKEEQTKLHEQLQNDPTNVDLQLMYEQATSKVISAQEDVRKATIATTNALKDEQLATIQHFNDIAGGLGNVLGAFNDMFTAMAESNEKYQKFATAMALSQIYVSMAASIAQAVQAAVQAGGFTGPAAPITIPLFIAELVAIVASTIGSTISTLNKAKESQSSVPHFYTGGSVDRGQSGVDKVPAMLTKGEYVISKPVVDRVGLDFLNSLNFGKLKVPFNTTGHYATGGMVQGSVDMDYSQMKDVMKEAFTESLEAMPAPILDVREVTNTQNRVKIKEQISR